MGTTWATTLAIIVVADVIGTSAQAQNNQQSDQWCAYFTGGPTQCEFATFAQCLQAIKGKTGLCERQQQSVTPATPAPSSPNRHRRHQHRGQRKAKGARG